MFFKKKQETDFGRFQKKMKKEFRKKMKKEKKNPEPKIVREYDPRYSFTKEEVEKAKNWQIAHRQKNHPEGETYQGAIGVERFKWEMYATSIGMIRRCYCATCEKKYFEEEKVVDPPVTMEEILGGTKEERIARNQKRRDARKALEEKWDYECDFSDL